MGLINIVNLICPVQGVMSSAIPKRLGRESLPHQQDEEEAKKAILDMSGDSIGIQVSLFVFFFFFFPHRGLWKKKTSLHQGKTKYIKENLVTKCIEI